MSSSLNHHRRHRDDIFAHLYRYSEAGPDAERVAAPHSLSRRVDLDHQFADSAARHPARIMTLDERRWLASPYRAPAEVPRAAEAASQPQSPVPPTADTPAPASPTSPTSPTSPGKGGRGGPAAAAPPDTSVLSEWLAGLTRLGTAQRSTDAAKRASGMDEGPRRRAGLIELPIQVPKALLPAPERTTLVVPQVRVSHALCEGALSTVVVDVGPGEAVRVARVGSPLALAPPIVVCAGNLSRSHAAVVRPVGKSLVGDVDEVDAGDWCDAVTPSIAATACTVYLDPPGRCATVAWSMTDVLDDGVVGGADEPTAGSVSLTVPDGCDAIVVQSAVVDDFSWRLERVK